jgi:hypothetical protein
MHLRLIFADIISHEVFFSIDDISSDKQKGQRASLLIAQFRLIRSSDKLLLICTKFYLLQKLMKRIWRLFCLSLAIEPK